jgi:rubrerythrin
MRTIDADELKKTIINICGNCSNIIREYKDGVPDGNCAIQHIMNMIDNAPTVEERPKGEWLLLSDVSPSGFGTWVCSQCGHGFRGIKSKMPYCTCGADMRGEEE